MSLVSSEEFEQLRAKVRERYAQSGQPPEVVKALNEHNDRVLRHAEDIARGEGLDQEETDILKTVSILHDIAKADTHLMLHADVGGEDAARALRNLGKDESLIDTVVQGIRCHMGPFPFIEEEAQKYAERTGEHVHHPRPASKLDRLFYDADMLALIDIKGIEKVVVLRQTTPDFVAEDEKVAAQEGITSRAAAYRSAMQSVQRAADTLFSETARALAADLVKDAQRHVTARLTAEEAPAS
jgi:hypothetical protein